MDGEQPPGIQPCRGITSTKCVRQYRYVHIHMHTYICMYVDIDRYIDMYSGSLSRVARRQPAFSRARASPPPSVFQPDTIYIDIYIHLHM